jgi:hypothetical protein
MINGRNSEIDKAKGLKFFTLGSILSDKKVSFSNVTAFP